ncbi:uncharacterized protein FA14DRAFT_174796 [Meira miltonrushii]|uniref:Uncharacterized protein n=1 Tax=Meira miltonrushii TaxID=1280837 RepID=A0A316V2Y0_9BASI|nr:uncharacterized protein FA14DRAFT_174796 [Meira miltonrushii]PWN31916.1 hypothetical protein FA14DRAFT_174796 [Meira miltonrushii]
MTGSVPPPPPPPFNQPSGGGSMNHYNSPHTDLYNRRTFPGQFPQGMQPGMNMASAPPSTSHRSSFPQGQVPPPPPPPPSAHQQHPSMSPQQSYGMPMHMQQQNPYAQSPYPMMNPMAQPGMGQMQMGYPPQMQPPGMHQMQSGHPGYMGAAMNPYTGMPMAPGYGQMGMNPYGYGPAYNPVDAAARAYHEGYDGHGSGRDSHRHRHSHDFENGRDGRSRRSHSRSNSGSSASSEGEAKAGSTKKGGDNQRVKDMMIGAVSGAILEKGIEKYRDHREHKKASSSKGD